MFRATNADKAISRRQVGDKAQIVVDEDSELEIEGVSVSASPLMGERVPPERDHVSKSLSLPGLTIEEIVPISTPIDPVGWPSISVVETNLDIPKAEVVSPVEAITKEEPSFDDYQTGFKGGYSKFYSYSY